MEEAKAGSGTRREASYVRRTAHIESQAVLSDVHTTMGARALDTPVPVRFVHNDRYGAQEAIADDDFDALLASRDDIRASFSENGDLAWTVQTWCRLRDQGVGGIELATEPAAGRINLAKSKTLSRRGADTALFYVSIQADYPRILWAQFHIQQNADLLCEDGGLIHHWPQAGLIPRDPSRDTVERVGFLGNFTGNLAGSAEDWSSRLSAEGLDFVAHEPERWHDFSDIDVAIGLRSFGNRRHSRKPPSKLFNAWIAGVPFIGGSESAFAQVGTAGIDHLVAHTQDEAVAQIARIRNDSGLYADIVAAGHEKAQQYSFARIASQWVDLLEGPVAARYREWAAYPGREKRRTAALSAAQGTIDLGKFMARKLLGREVEA